MGFRFRQRREHTTYTCPGCHAWQLDAPWPPPRDLDPKAVDDALTEHRKECPELSAIYARAVARAADKEVPVAPALPADTTVSELEAEITELARKAARNGRAARDYISWHERINDLLTWREEALAAAKVAPVEFSE